MAKSSNQKLKLLYIIKMLSEHTDEMHPITTNLLIEKLNTYNILAERKSIYDDIRQLTDFGYDILTVESRRGGGYYLASQTFQLPELKLLVDAVQSSRFISIKKSRELIKKLEQLTSKYEASHLQRQVYVSDQVKTNNERVYYDIDTIYMAIQNDVQITFCYLEWTTDKVLVPRKNGQQYQISPWALIWKEENYYLLGFDTEDCIMKHFRVDKLDTVRMNEKKRLGAEQFNSINIANYTNQAFGMYSGSEEVVTLTFQENIVGVLLDRFGKDVSIRVDEAGQYLIRIRVMISGQFFGWIAGLGNQVKINSPDYVRTEYINWLDNIRRMY